MVIRRSEEEEMVDTQHGIQNYLLGGYRVRGINARRASDGGTVMSVIVKGSIKGTNTELEMVTDNFGQQIITPGEAAFTELTRQGQGWQTIAVSAVAGLVARPTVTTGIEIWNGNAGGGASLVIARLFSHELVTSTTGLGGGAGIWAQVTVPKAAPTAAGLAIIGLTGKAYSGAVVTGVGTTVVANGWFPWGPTVKKESAGAVVPGGQLDALVNGMIVVPPQCSLCVTVVSGYAADTFCSGATWYEKVFPANYALM